MISRIVAACCWRLLIFLPKGKQGDWFCLRLTISFSILGKKSEKHNGIEVFKVSLIFVFNALLLMEGM